MMGRLFHIHPIMYQVEGDAVRERFPHKWCAYSVSRVESIPFYHAYPGSRCLVIGTAGCNFDCRYCSNSYVAKEDPVSLQDIMVASLEIRGGRRDGEAAKWVGGLRFAKAFYQGDGGHANWRE